MLCSLCGKDCLDNDDCYLNRIDALKESLAAANLQVEGFRKVGELLIEEAREHLAQEGLAFSRRPLPYYSAGFNALLAAMDGTKMEPKGERILLDDVIKDMEKPKCDHVFRHRGGSKVHDMDVCDKCGEHRVIEKRKEGS